MALDAVQVHIGGADFFLLPEETNADGARELANRLERVRGTDAALRLRPRLAPASADWTDPGADADLDLPADSELTGHEDPGTAWRDVSGDAIGDVTVVALDTPTVLWHWTLEREDETFEVG